MLDILVKLGFCFTNWKKEAPESDNNKAVFKESS